MINSLAMVLSCVSPNDWRQGTGHGPRTGIDKNSTVMELRAIF